MDVPSDDDVIVHRNLQRPRHLDDLARHVDGTARRSSGAGLTALLPIGGFSLFAHCLVHCSLNERGDYSISDCFGKFHRGFQNFY